MWMVRVTSNIAGISDLDWYIHIIKGGLIDIRNCTNLCKLRLYANRDSLGSRSPYRILSQVSSQNLADLTLEFTKVEKINLDWTSIADILSGSMFTHLGNIHIESTIYSSSVEMRLEQGEWEAAEMSIRQGPLAIFDQRGILHFSLFKYERGSKYVAISFYRMSSCF